MIRVLHVVFTLEPGGMENGVVNVAQRLPADEFQIDVCCLEHGGDFVNRLPGSSNVYTLDKKPGKSASSTWRLFNLIRSTRPDLLHTHNLGPLIYGGLSSFFGRLCPILHGEHGQLPPVELTPRRLRQRRILYKWCTCIHTVSTGLSEHLADLGLVVNATSVVNGVDTERFTPGDRRSARHKLGIEGDGLVLGVVGRFVPVKRQRALLAAFAKIGEQVPDSHLVLIGDGPDRAVIEADVAGHPFADRIVLPGYVSSPEEVYPAMDLLVAPSLIEGLSNAVLEAMACGTPVLSHKACGSSEAIEDGVSGFIVNIASDERLAEALIASMGSPARLVEMGTAARRRAEESFSLDRMAEGYAHLYRRVSGAGGER